MPSSTFTVLLSRIVMLQVLLYSHLFAIVQKGGWCPALVLAIRTCALI